MKVYVVLYNDLNGDSVVDIFTTKEKAEQFVKPIDDGRYTIVAWDIS